MAYRIGPVSSGESSTSMEMSTDIGGGKRGRWAEGGEGEVEREAWREGGERRRERKTGRRKKGERRQTRGREEERVEGEMEGGKEERNFCLSCRSAVIGFAVGISIGQPSNAHHLPMPYLRLSDHRKQQLAWATVTNRKRYSPDEPSVREIATVRRQPLSGEREKRAGRNTVTEDRLCRTARATETIGISTTFVTGFLSIESVTASFAYPVAFYESCFLYSVLERVPGCNRDLL